MEGKLQNEQCDLKRFSNVMTVMSKNSKKAVLTVSDEASCTAFKRLKALEKKDDNDMFDDEEKVDMAHQKCNQYISKNSTMLFEKLKSKRKSKAIRSRKSMMESDSLIEEGDYLVCLVKDGSKVQLSKPSKENMYMPAEIWQLIADNVKKKNVRSVLILLIDGKTIP
eukprot:14793775-Ditylum_brightwellii.AAC.1